MRRGVTIGESTCPSLMAVRTTDAEAEKLWLGSEVFSSGIFFSADGQGTTPASTNPFTSASSQNTSVLATKLSELPRNPPNTPMWGMPQLTQVALAFCNSARCTVELVGRLAEQNGFFGEDPGIAGAGETITVGDGKELWLMHLTANLSAVSERRPGTATNTSTPAEAWKSAPDDEQK